MFKSKRRPITIPQAEHGKLAGTLAWLWGNAQFDLPNVSRASFVAGIGLHDRGYGPLDNAAIGETSDDKWFQITRNGFYMPCSDPAADLITKFHLRRLVSWGDSAGHKAMLIEMEAVIEAQFEQNGFDREEFERIDRLTRLCDSLSFDFCFEAPAEGEVRVFPKNGAGEELLVRYSVRDGDIRVDPWPFSVDAYSGYLVGYRLENFPAVLDAVIVPFRLIRG